MVKLFISSLRIYNFHSRLPASFHYAVFLNEGRTQTQYPFRTAVFRFAQNVFLNFYEGRTQSQYPFRTAVFRFAQNVFLNFYEGRTQTQYPFRTVVFRFAQNVFLNFYEGRTQSLNNHAMRDCRAFLFICFFERARIAIN